LERELINATSTKTIMNKEEEDNTLNEPMPKGYASADITFERKKNRIASQILASKNTQLVDSVDHFINLFNEGRPYDPETGEFLNDASMKAIKDAEQGKTETFNSVDDLINAL
jgi:hypothetical protein